MPHPRIILLITMLAAFLNGTVFGILPNLINFSFGPIVVPSLGFILTLLVIRKLVDYDWRTNSNIHKLAMVAGSLTPFLLFAPFQELDQSRVDNTSGMTLVGFTALFLLFLLYRNLRKSEKMAQILEIIIQ